MPVGTVPSFVKDRIRKSRNRSRHIRDGFLRRARCRKTAVSADRP